jgi:hypothetical protein
MTHSTKGFAVVEALDLHAFATMFDVHYCGFFHGHSEHGIAVLATLAFWSTIKVYHGPLGAKLI